MADQQLILEDSFWKFLVSIEELKEKKEIIIFCSSLSIDEKKLENYCEFLNRFKVTVQRDEQHIYPFKEQCLVKVEFKLSEWLALQFKLQNKTWKSSDSEVPKYHHKIVENKIKIAQKFFSQFSLLENMSEEKLGNKYFCDFENLRNKIDREIVARKVMKIVFGNRKECDIFPCRLVFLDGALCVVGESVADKMLVYFNLEDISNVVKSDIGYVPNFSQVQVNEFVGYLCSINGKEERLVLKIYNKDEIDLLPSHHHLGNPFITSSLEGDLIWAATLEVCDEVFHWLYEMRHSMEILDPDHIRKEFSSYCELKKENSNIKKVS